MHNKCSFKAENIHIISHAYTLMHTHNLPLSTPKKKLKKEGEKKGATVTHSYTNMGKCWTMVRLNKYRVKAEEMTTVTLTPLPYSHTQTHHSFYLPHPYLWQRVHLTITVSYLFPWLSVIPVNFHTKLSCFWSFFTSEINCMQQERKRTQQNVSNTLKVGQDPEHLILIEHIYIYAHFGGNHPFFPQQLTDGRKMKKMNIVYL